MASPAPGGQPGDLLIGVKIAHHPQFKRNGRDILALVTAPISTFVLGGTVPIPTLEGDKKSDCEQEPKREHSNDYVG